MARTNTYLCLSQPIEKLQVLKTLADALELIKRRKINKARGPGPDEAHKPAGALAAAEAVNKAQLEEPTGNIPGSGAEERQIAEKLPTPEKSDHPEKAPPQATHDFNPY